MTRFKLSHLPAVALLSLACVNHAGATTCTVPPPPFPTPDPFVLVTDYGATGDGLTNDRPCIEAAINAAMNTGDTVYFPAGEYRIDVSASTSGSLLVRQVGLVGPEVRAAGNGTNRPFASHGAVISIDGGEDNPAFRVLRGASFRRLQFLHRNQAANTNVVFPNEPTLLLEPTAADSNPVRDVVVENCVFINSRVAIDLLGGGFIWIRDNSIYGIDRGIVIRRTANPVYITNNSFTFAIFTPIAPFPQTAIHTLEAGQAVTVGDTVALSMTGNAVFGYRRGLRVVEGQLRLSTISDNLFDQVLEGIRTTKPASEPGADLTGISSTTIHGNRFFTKTTVPSVSQAVQDSGRAISFTGGGDHSVNIVDNFFGVATKATINVNTPGAGSVTIGHNTFSGGRTPPQGNLRVQRSPSVAIDFSANQLFAGSSSSSACVQVVNGGDLTLSDNTFADMYKVLDVQAASSLVAGGNVSRRTQGPSACTLGVAATGLGNAWDKPAGCPGP